MAYQSGIADNEIDLLDKLNLFLTTDSELVKTGDNWTEIYSGETAATATIAKRKSYAWSAPGATAGNNIYVACKTDNRISNDTYNLYFCGGTYFNVELINQPNDIFSGMLNRTQVGLFADNNPLHYWFFANNRRFIVVTKMTTVYSSCYCGFMLPNALPNEYPYPLVIAGSCNNELQRYSITTDYFASIIDPRINHFYVFTPAQSWQQFYGSKGSQTKLVYPRGIEKFYYYGNKKINVLTASPDSYSPLYPVSIVDVTKGATQFWGALDGVYWVPGLSRAAEDTISTDDGREFIIFQNGFRVTNIDFFAIEKV
ncbi:hypothetical protein GYW75_03765 [Gilliamella sp. ESL0232]|uniref:hypothetical protein n=1 Tax=unclassified Gilliamella TaxID=2685620 RepID=UPI00158086A4|nr:hypothetical protein [Gilliamella sp. ESL0232]NUE95505.1 hypothetical protein [Gilliamella sp. ESL0232]